MKSINRQLAVFWMVAVATTVMAICLGASWNAASAQSPSTTTTTDAAQASALPYGAAEVVKMQKESIQPDVIVTYINSTSLPYYLNASQIITLKNMGVPENVILAMVHRASQLHQTESDNSFSPSEPLVTSILTVPAVTMIDTWSYPAFGTGYPIYGMGYPYGYGYGWSYGGMGMGFGNWGWGFGVRQGFDAGIGRVQSAFRPGGGFRGGGSGMRGGGGGAMGPGGMRGGGSGAGPR